MVTKEIEIPSKETLKHLQKLYAEGKIDDTEKLAVSISQQFPRHPFSLMVLADLCRKNDRMLESLDYRKKLVEINPENASFHLDLANTMHVLDKLKLAEESFRTALKLNPNFAEAYNNFGVLLRNLHRFSEAEISFNKALMLMPDFAEAYNNLGILMRMLNKIKKAKKNFEKALELKGSFIEAQNNLGRVLKELGLIQEAKVSFEKTLTLEPNNYIAHYNLGLFEFDNKKFKEALERFKLINSNESKTFQLRCAYLLNEKSYFYKCLDHLINEGEVNAVIGAHSSFSEARYGIKKHNPFCNDPLKYVLTSDLTEKYDFDKIFIKGIKKIINDDNIKYRNQELLKNGKQTTGDLLDLENDTINQIKVVIHSEIERYRFHFKNSKEGLLKNFPDEYYIKGWLVIMKSGGNLRAHMHDLGWLSGSIYINVPPKLKKNAGNLAVSKTEDDNPDELHENKLKKSFSFLTNKFQPSTKKIIDVVTGSLCLFPSSLLHQTIPFEAEEERIVLAFDVIKK